MPPRPALDIVNLSPDALIVLGTGGDIQAWNPAAERIFGIDAGQALGAQAYLVRPIEPLDLLARLREVLGADRPG
jgi:PAS domain S-box-containing protein